MSAQTDGPVYWDPYRPDLGKDPYPTFKRMRNEAPLYFNQEYNFYALSKFADIDKHFGNTEIFSSARSDIMEFIREDIDVPPGMFIWHDPPMHTAYRSIVTRVFTPKRMNALEQQIRDFCAKCLDPLVGKDKIDFISDLGDHLPGGVIGMLLGIPEQDQQAVRERIESSLRTEEGKPMTAEQASYTGEGFEDYIDWRMQNPSDDLMTELLNAEFTDPEGVKRKLTRDEVLIFVNVIAGAGNETTAKLIGWMGKLLGENPEQRRQIAADPKLINPAIEEILRMEPPGPSVARHVTQDVEIHGQVVPAGSVMLFLLASANRDEDRYTNGEQFDIHRKDPPHITFGRGVHACLGAALARVEGRVALEEILKRFPDWTVDLENAKLSSSSSTRGWDNMPVIIG